MTRDHISAYPSLTFGTSEPRFIFIFSSTGLPVAARIPQGAKIILAEESGETFAALFCTVPLFIYYWYHNNRAWSTMECGLVSRHPQVLTLLGTERESPKQLIDGACGEIYTVPLIISRNGQEFVYHHPVAKVVMGKSSHLISEPRFVVWLVYARECADSRHRVDSSG